VEVKKKMNMKTLKKIIADYSGFIEADEIKPGYSLMEDLEFDEDSLGNLLDALSDEFDVDFFDYDYDDDDTIRALANYIKYQ